MRGAIDLSAHPLAGTFTAPCILYAVTDRGPHHLWLVLAHSLEHAHSILDDDGWSGLNSFNTTTRVIQRGVPEEPGVVDVFEMSGKEGRGP